MLRKCKFGPYQTKLNGDHCTFMISSVTSVTMVVTDCIQQQ